MKDEKLLLGYCKKKHVKNDFHLHSTTVPLLLCDYFTSYKNISMYFWKVLSVSAQIRQYDQLLLLPISNNFAFQVALLSTVKNIVTSLLYFLKRGLIQAVI